MNHFLAKRTRFFRIGKTFFPHQKAAVGRLIWQFRGGTAAMLGWTCFRGRAPVDLVCHAMASTSQLTPSEFAGSASEAISPSAAELLRQARGGAPASLGWLLETTRKYLLTVADRKLENELRGKVDASDLVQDTFLEAQRDFSKFEGSTERELLAWLCAILGNRFLNAVRHYRRTQKRDVSRELAEGAEGVLSAVAAESPTPRTNLIAQEEQRCLQAAFELLPHSTREVLVLRIWERASFAEIGAACNCSTEAARKRFVRAIEELKSVLEQIGAS